MVGNAMPEAEQGLNVGRLISLMGLKLKMFLGNGRYCASGLETIGMATAKIQSGMAHCIVQVVQQHSDGRLQAYSGLCCCKSRKRRLLLGMGLTEAVAQQFKVSREIKMNLLITLI
jgi:acetyl-CoA acyltransferase